MVGLAGRTIQLVSDVSLEEQLYLFQRARLLKASVAGKSSPFEAAGASAPALCEVEDAAESLKMNDPDSTVYLIFMEGSTRTKESLRNAAVYQGVKVNEFQAETSSFQKSETITDTMKMLSLYSTQRSIFVIRSPLEGVCTWLQTVMPAHAAKFGLPTPSFLNAGDGRNAHPVGELADVFSLLEQCRWDRSSIHMALVGDLAHVRTAHSKVEGLKVFKKVRVDLVAPSMLAYPIEYRNKMRKQGFEVREFHSIEEYLQEAGADTATIWYFYKPQFKRFGDITKEFAADMQAKITFKAEWQSKLNPDSCFFQTLPRDKVRPLVDLALDITPLNGWDRHASNTNFVHIVLLGMLFGKAGRGIPTRPEDRAESKASSGGLKRPTSLTSVMASVYPFAGEVNMATLPSFLQPIDLSQEERLRRPDRARPGGAVPIRNGLVVDHIGTSADSAECWTRLHLVRTILSWGKHIGSEGVYESSSHGGKRYKAIICLPDFEFETVSVPQMKTLASVAPGCTINAIKGSKVFNKFRLKIPERIYNLPNINCRNAECVSYPPNKQRDINPYFERVPFYETSALPNCEEAEFLFVCRYCRWPHRYGDIWKH